MTGPSGTVTSTSDAYGQQGAQGTQSNTYDALGRDVGITVTSGATTTLSYEGTTGQLTSDGAASYTWTPDGTLTGTANSPGTGVLDFTDHHTDLTGQFTATGAALSGSRTFGPWGATIATGGTLAGSLGYQSQYTSPATGQVDMGARWYNPATGSFGNKDTVANKPVPDSASASPFGYAADNPLGATDPTGHMVLNDNGTVNIAATQAAAKAFAIATAKAAAKAAAAKAAAAKAAAAKKQVAAFEKKSCPLSLPLSYCAQNLRDFSAVAASPAVRAAANTAAKKITTDEAKADAALKAAVNKPVAAVTQPSDTKSTARATIVLEIPGTSILRTPLGLELGASIQKTPIWDLGPEILITPGGVMGPLILSQPGAPDLGTGTETYPVGTQGTIVNAAKAPTSGHTPGTSAGQRAHKAFSDFLNQVRGGYAGEETLPSGKKLDGSYTDPTTGVKVPVELSRLMTSSGRRGQRRSPATGQEMDSPPGSGQIWQWSANSNGDYVFKRVE